MDLPQLVIENHCGGTRVTIMRPHHTMANAVDYPKDFLKDCLKELTKRQREIFLMVQKWSISEPLDEPLNTTSLSKKMNISLSTIKRELSMLQNKGLIVRVGGRKGGHWEVKP